MGNFGKRKFKNQLIVALVIWFVLVLIFIPFMATSIGQATGADGFKIFDFELSILKLFLNGAGSNSFHPYR